MDYINQRVTKSIVQVRMDVIDNCKTNAFVVRGLHANYVIDTGFGSLTSQHLSELLATDKDTYIINTHFHWDHIWGNAFFDKGIIIQHNKCKNFTELYWDDMCKKYSHYKHGIVKRANPSITFDSQMELNSEMLLFYTPGHSDDSISAYFYADRALFVGDNFGDNDTDIIPVLDSQPDSFKNTLQKYANLKPDYILSGHNDVRGMETLNKMIDFVKDKVNGA